MCVSTPPPVYVRMRTRARACLRVRACGDACVRGRVRVDNWMSRCVGARLDVIACAHPSSLAGASKKHAYPLYSHPFTHMSACEHTHALRCTHAHIHTRTQLQTVPHNSVIRTHTQRERETYFPTKFSSTELLPALWPPTTAICGRSMGHSRPSCENASW